MSADVYATTRTDSTAIALRDPDTGRTVKTLHAAAPAHTHKLIALHAAGYSAAAVAHTGKDGRGRTITLHRINHHEPLVVVGCSNRKAEPPHSPRLLPAAQMYVGSFHRLAMRAAFTLTTPKRVLILSARHGLLAPLDPITSYDHNLHQLGAIDSTRLHAQARLRGVSDLRPVIILTAGYDYTHLAMAVFPWAAAPLAVPGWGIGHKRRHLAHLIAVGTDNTTDHGTRPLDPPATESP